MAESWNGPSSVSLPAEWTAGRPYDYNLTRADLQVSIKIVLYRQTSGPSFFYGFTCYYESVCYFGLFIFQLIEEMESIQPVIVWSANHGKPMKHAARLQLTEEGDLVLLGDDGNKIWSTDTKRKSAMGLNLTEAGNVVLYDRSNAVIWQSFDHPADCLLPGQALHPGMKLTSPVPDGRALIYTFAVEDHVGFVASVTTPSSSQTYYRTSDVRKMTSNIGQVAALYGNKSFGEFDLPATSLAHLIMLESDGHLRHYVHDGNYSWKKEDLLKDRINDCGYPQVKADDVEDDDPDLQRLHLTRFPYEDLKTMTGDFNNKLGEGGFGSVFLGNLPSGVRIAVKRLDGFGQIKKVILGRGRNHWHYPSCQSGKTTWILC
ncbi:hypothetical protein NL676_017338 [Syzygium grande]|nr:hypothetical protein NL676_017338 [Syzygium grande]